jgi:hypothetical protein
MRKKHSFLLTILPDENDSSPVHGRLEVIATGQSEMFSSLEELLVLLEHELRNPAEGMAQQVMSGSKSQI